jgi:ribose transport system permease protein
MKGPSEARLAAETSFFARIKAAAPILGLLLILVVFLRLLALKGQLGNFLGSANLQYLMHTSSVGGIVALGMLLIIISGGIDLSVGSVVSLVMVVTMQVYIFLGYKTGSVLLASLGAVTAGIGVGGLAGLVNGLVITLLRVAPFVATLGMMSVARGLAVWLSDRTLVSFPSRAGFPKPSWIESLSSATGAGYGLVDPGVWSWLLLAVVVALILRFTVFGRYSYAIGSNEATARLCGVNVDRCKVAIYTLAGLLTGWAGVLAFAQTSSGDPNAEKELALDVIAAVVIGGASLSGGQGTVFGTLLGVLILGVMGNGVGFLNQAVEVKYILIGAIVIVNTALSQWQRRRNE